MTKIQTKKSINKFIFTIWAAYICSKYYKNTPKHFNKKHEVIIYTEYKAQESGENGNVVPHREVVEGVKYYMRNCEDSEVVEVFILAEKIKDIYKQIMEIETPVVDMPIDDKLPF